MGDRVIVGFELMDRGERSTERREFWREEGESVSDLVTPLLSLLTLGVAGDDLAGVSDNPDLDLEAMECEAERNEREEAGMKVREEEGWCC